MENPLLPALTVARYFTSWQWHPVSALVATLLLVAYAAAVARVRRRGGSWPVARTASWTVGVAILVLATQGSLAVYSDALFWMHMVQHLVLIMVAPIALVLGRPLDLAVAVAGRHRAGVRRVLTGGVVAVVTHPLVTLVLYTVAIAGTHLTGFMNAMMEHPWLHGLEIGVYVATGCLFFAPLVSDTELRWRLSQPMRLMLLVVAMPVDTFTGVILGQTQHYPWPAMLAAHPAWALGPLDDLHLGGGVMWVGGDAIMALLMGVAAVRWAGAAGRGDGSELGGWLTAARVNHQRTLAAQATAVTTPDAGDELRTGDSDADLADYNAYLARLHRSGR